MRVLLASPGPAGETDQFLALGAALRNAGHTATIIADEQVRFPAKKLGLSFLPCPADSKISDWPALQSIALKTQSRLEEIACWHSETAPLAPLLLPLVQSQIANHDILAFAQEFAYLKNVARKSGKASAMVVASPLGLPLGGTLPENAGPAPSWLPRFLLPWWERKDWHADEKKFDDAVNQAVGSFLLKSGMGKFSGFFADPADVACVAVSPTLFPPQGGLPQKYVQTGFFDCPFPLDDSANDAIARVRKIEQTGAPLPVVVLQNAPVAEQGDAFAKLLGQWPRGAPLVVQSERSNLAADPSRPEVLVVGALPMEELFTHASVVVHGGDARSTTAALRAGRPQVIHPQNATQRWWASTVQNLGVANILNAAHWQTALRPALETTLCDVPMLRRVVECCSRVRSENGCAAAVRELEKLAATS